MNSQQFIQDSLLKHFNHCLYLSKPGHVMNTGALMFSSSCLFLNTKAYWYIEHVLQHYEQSHLLSWNSHDLKRNPSQIFRGQNFTWNIELICCSSKTYTHTYTLLLIGFITAIICGTGVWTQGLILLGRHFTTWTTPPALDFIFKIS
jgi:hypothetical protein